MNAGWTVPTDAMWARVAPMPSGKATDPGVTAADNRQFIEAVPWRFCTGSRWRDIPECFGNWNSVRRLRRWALSGVFDRAFNALSEEFDHGHVFVDGTIFQAHQKASGAKAGPEGRGSDASGAACRARSWRSWTRGAL